MRLLITGKMKYHEGEWFAVVNPHAGSGKTIPQWNKAKAVLMQAGITFNSSMTDCKYHATDLTTDACEAGYRDFIAVGGDGTLHEVLAGVMSFVNKNPKHKLSEFTLAVIPIGSGNDWIRTHKIPRKPELIANLIANKSFVKQDIVKVTVYDEAIKPYSRVLNEAYMINVGGVAFDAQVCRRVNLRKEQGKSGKLHYLRALIATVFRYKPAPLAVLCDDELVFEGDCLSIALGIGKYSGGGMRQTPAAIVDDGLVELTIIPKLSYARIALEARRLFTGSIMKAEGLIFKRGKKVVVLPGNNTVSEPVEVDGEIVGLAPVVFEVLPDQINVLSGN